MAVKVVVKPILPKINKNAVNDVRMGVRRATLNVTNLAAEELRFLVETWQHKPQPKVKMEVTPNEIKGSAITEDKAMFMLDGGTDERWAVMTRNFQAKTRSGSLRSGHGRGGVRIRGRAAMTRAGIPAQDGIKKRGFSDKLVEKYEPIFNNEIDKVMNDAISKGQATP